jgi:N-formylglutamate amidohydrolase
MTSEALDVFEPDGEPSPVVVDVPHAGLEVPAGLTPALLLDGAAIRRDADLDVHRLYAAAPEHGATLVVFRPSRFVLDPNRAEGDVDRLSVADHPSPRADAPRGLVWRVTTDGAPVMERPLRLIELSDRLERFWRPHRRAIREALEARRRRFGFAILLDGHSMPSVGRAGHEDPGVRRADVVPGTRGGTTCDARVKDCVESVLRGRGYSVVHDTPYRGGDITGTFGHPGEGLHSIQIEVNRDLYMDEATLRERPDGFRRLAEALVDVVRELGSIDLRR